MAKDVIVAADLGGTPLTPDELAAIPDFAGIRKEIWSKFPGAIARKDFRPGELLMREGESGTTAFYLLSGSVEIFVNNPTLGVQSKRRAVRKSRFGGFTKITNYVKGVPDRTDGSRPVRTHIPMDASVDLPMDNPVATLDAGELFGEMAALAALKQEKLKRPKFYPRSATVRARTDVVALEMLPNILNNVLYNAPAFKEKLNNSYRTRSLDTHLRSVPIFANLSQEFLDYIRQRVELVDFQPGQFICKQGEIADAFYLIRLGFVKVSQEFPGGEMVLTYLSRGSYFGEMGLLPPAFRVRARGAAAGQLAECVLSREPLLCGRAPEGERALPVPWDDYISRDHFRMSVEGKQVRVNRLPSGKNPVTFRMQPANSFLVSPGESFLVGGTTFEVLEDPSQTGRRTATCTAMDYVQLVRMKAEDFAKMLDQFPEVEAAVTEVARARRQMGAQILSRVQTVSMNDFLKQELMQGQNLLLLDLEKCTRCDECTKACAATHEDHVTRLIREGLRFDKYLVATSCRACMDPLCMTRCPVGSIRRKESLDIVIENWCIGCGNCAIDCPYGNINVVDLAGGGKQAEPRPKAVVCDLCVEYAEPNCVRACPHGAAIRVEPKTFFARDLAGMQLAVPASGPAAPPAPERAIAAETRIVSNIADLLPMLPRLRVRSGPRTGAVLQLRYPSTSFGRAPESDYRFADDEKISRIHCMILCENNRFLLRDMNSTNGTMVNSNPITEIELRAGDVIQFGELELEFLAGEFRS
ncbi:MAG: cyclic nucleotide-binding domain-containing protein [Acidobacteria bacterium]|nr:cyclic nucleotide-binding domain-containing protein [Acidobacteriota bacterium]